MPTKKRLRHRAPHVNQESKSLTTVKRSFLDLPFEVRHEVYLHYFDDRPPTPKRAATKSSTIAHSDPEWTGQSMLLTCRLIYVEAWPIYTRHFTFKAKNVFELATDFLPSLSYERTLNIRHITLTPHRRLNNTTAMLLEWAWWFHLDLFARLDTLTIEGYGWSLRSFTSTMQTAIGLLEQGWTREPVKINERPPLQQHQQESIARLEKMASNPPPPPFSSTTTTTTTTPTWAVHYGNIHSLLTEKNHRKSDAFLHRVVIQQNGGITSGTAAFADCKRSYHWEVFDLSPSSTHPRILRRMLIAHTPQQTDDDDDDVDDSNEAEGEGDTEIELDLTANNCFQEGYSSSWTFALGPHSCILDEETGEVQRRAQSAYPISVLSVGGGGSGSGNGRQRRRRGIR